MAPSALLGILPASTVGVVVGAAVLVVCATAVVVLARHRAASDALVRALTEDLVASQQEVEAATVRLREVEAMKTSFLVTVSHELRTPLTAIRGCARLLERQEGHLSTDERNAFLTQMARSAEGLSDLLQEVLEFAEIEQNGPSTLRISFDLNEVVDEAIDRLETTHHVALQRMPDLTAMGDPRSFGRALGNVLANARAYSPLGSTIGVWSRPGPDDSTLEVVVDDEGPGIPAIERDRVFERFYRGEQTAGGTITGTGIGLTVARQVLTGTGGSIEVGESPGGGTRVTLRVLRSQASLPLVDVSITVST